MSIYKKEIYNIKDIQWLIDNQIEEGVNLDFKANGSLGKSDGKKKEISKDVSAFANSSGGIIIYGLTENNHVADSFSFIDGNLYTKEWLEHVINSNISKRISNLKIYPIRNNGRFDETIYLVKIPESDFAPHMAKDGKYYKRFNFESQTMQEFEVRQLYFKSKKSELDFENLQISEGHLHNRTYKQIQESNSVIELINTFGKNIPNSIKAIGFDLSIFIKNIGLAPEEKFKLMIECPIHLINGKPKVERKLNVLKSPPYRISSDRKKNIDLISVESNSIIFPGEIFEVWKCSIVYNEINAKFIDENPFIKLTILYSNGMKEKIINVKERVMFQNQILNKELFKLEE